MSAIITMVTTPVASDNIGQEIVVILVVVCLGTGITQAPIHVTGPVMSVTTNQATAV